MIKINIIVSMEPTVTAIPTSRSWTQIVPSQILVSCVHEGYGHA